MTSNFGGCKLGERKIDQHELLWEKLGFTYTYKNGLLVIQKGIGICEMAKEFSLAMDTTMGTIASIFAVAFGRLRTVSNISQRPEIGYLVSFIRALGVDISLAEKSVCFHSVEKNLYVEELVYSIPSDWDEILGYACLCHSLKMDADICASIDRIPAFNWLESVSAGEIQFGENRVIVRPEKKNSLFGDVCRIESGPYPLLGSDMQPILSIWASQHYSRVEIKDSKFFSRFSYLRQLGLYGWKSEINLGFACTSFVSESTSSDISLDITDLRTGFSFLIAAAILKKSIVLKNFEQLLRGYHDIIDNLKSIGASIDVIPLGTHNSVAIILKDKNNYYYLQKRDLQAKRNRGLVTLFGGAVENSESFEQAIRRELKEELGIKDLELHVKGDYVLNASICSISGTVHLYEAFLSDENIPIQANEGQLLRCSIEEALHEPLSNFARFVLEME